MRTQIGIAAVAFALSVVATGGSAPSPVAAARDQAIRLKTFADPWYGYTLRYPATWKLQPDVQIASLSKTDALLGPVGSILQAPNGIDGVVLIVKPGTSPAPFAAQARALLTQGVTIQGKIAFDTRTVGGVTFQSAQTTAKSSGGDRGQETVLRGVHGTHTYGILVVLLLNRPTTSQRRVEIGSILANITFM